MILGKTGSQIREEEQKRLEKLYLEEGVYKFAFFPTRIIDGRFVWLQKFWKSHEVERYCFDGKKTYYTSYCGHSIFLSKEDFISFQSEVKKQLDFCKQEIKKLKGEP